MSYWGRNTAAVSKDAPFRGEKNEPLLKVLSIKEKKYFKNFVLGGMAQSPKNVIFEVLFSLIDKTFVRGSFFSAQKGASFETAAVFRPQ